MNDSHWLDWSKLVLILLLAFFVPYSAMTLRNMARDIEKIAASVDTLPKGGNGVAGSVRSKGGAVPSDSEGDAQP